MKTAMQELLVLVEQIFSNAKTKEVESAVNDIINIITQEGILKEKEQIVDAHLEGWSDAYDYIYSDSNQQARQALDYYNETYNQNKS